ncbi:MAG: hypothetical protein ABSG70_04570 [Terriglobales bacterium]
MKKFRRSLFILSTALSVVLILRAGSAQSTAAERPIVGDWEGTLNPGAQPKKRIVVHIAVAQDGTLSGTIDYPDDDSSGIPITAITSKRGALHFESETSMVVYEGNMSQDKSGISGTWKQGGKALDLTLKRTP